jgi:hypothetical protein
VKVFHADEDLARKPELLFSVASVCSVFSVSSFNV